MIDVHVLTHEGTRPDWLAECLRSLESEPCTVHLVNNAGRKVGPGRAAGYKMGGHPLVSYVDSDDFVFPGAMQAVIDGLAHHTSVCTRELAIHNGVGFFKLPRGGHNLFAARRDAIEPLLVHMETIDYLSDVMVRRHLKPAQLDFLGYAWRLHDMQAHRNINNAMLRAEIERCPWPS